MGGQRRVAHQRADAQAPITGSFHLVQGQAIDVDQMRGRFDFQFHQVEQIRAAGDELGARRAQGGSRRFGRRGRLLVAEDSHAGLPATSVMASMILE
ncbi:hypothetical protein D3C72_2300730 [compost metagenome]